MNPTPFLLLTYKSYISYCRLSTPCSWGALPWRVFRLRAGVLTRRQTEKKHSPPMADCVFGGQAENNALEQAHFKNVAKPMFSGTKRTGFS
jgi:hypothetical protein